MSHAGAEAPDPTGPLVPDAVFPPGQAPPTGREQPMETRAMPRSVARLAWLLDDSIPLFAGRRVGIDGFLSFIPGVGDAAGFAMGAAVIVAAVRAGASTPTLIRMVLNALGETVTGMIPLLGPLISFVWKANQRNLRIVESELADHDATTRTSQAVVLWTIGLILLSLTILFAGLALVVVAVVRWVTG